MTLKQNILITDNQLFMTKRQSIMTLFVAALVFCVSATATAVNNLTKYVNPYIGTGGHGHVFLGANVPFGLVQLGPTQYTRGWDWCSGYHYSDSVLVGFGMMHLSGTGIGCLGDIALLPVKDKDQKDVVFSHKDETVCPGYYKVNLNNPKVSVELTATERVGFHRYTFNGGGDDALLALDLAQCIGWDTMTDCLLTQESPTRLTGYRRSTGWAKDRRIYFDMEFSRPVRIAVRDSMTRAVLAVKNDGQPLLVKVALSPVDIDKAKKNMQTELPGWNFDATKALADQKWNNELSRIDISTSDQKRKRIFYTALFHLMTAPSLFCDVDGDYRGADGRVRHASFKNYTTFSLWDTYRAAHPLMTLIFPEKQNDFAETFMNICDQQGKLPIWHLMGNETNCMIGSPGVPVLADLTLKGFVKDKERAFETMKKSMMLDERSLGLLKKYGYIPFDLDPTNETVAKGLENCMADNGVALVAKQLGKTDDYDYFFKRSRSYAKYFDKNTGFMRAVGSDGKFRTPFDPISAAHRVNDYTEGNAWQYTWLVPHDVPGLVKLFDSDKRFEEKLDSLFIVEGDLGENASPDISGLVGQYAHGNEPSHHIIYMYNYIGKPWKAAPLLRKMMNEMYHDAPDGLCGNEDVGQMSAWYIISAAGLYQVEPSGGRFIIGSPLFDKAVLNVGGGKTFTVTARNNSDTNIYVQKATLNGKPYTKSYIDFADIVKGGQLQLVMGSKPSKWGTKKADRPL